ncbi:MAG: PD40 domain-containing protein [Candidatus Eisenbacteria bacterium]|nr:PD40 domain-containing protein [Candidatus Eisenbacteria bacterium]
MKQERPFARTRGIVPIARLWPLFTLFVLFCGHHENPAEPDGAPSIVISSPAEGDTLSPVGFRVIGSAADPEGIASIRVELDGVEMGAASQSPFNVYVPSLLFEDGAEMEVTVRAEDGGGVTGTKKVTVFLRAIRFSKLASAGDQADTEREPSWSPDGASIAFVSEGDGGNRDIWTTAVSAGAAARITDSPNEDRSPDWAPFGSVIAFASDRSGNWDIWTVGTSGGAATQVTTNGSHDRGPAWSSSGTSIAFHSIRDGNWNIYTMPMSGGSAAGVAEQRTSAASAESSAVWTPNGSSLVFTGNQNGGLDLWSVTPPSLTLVAVPGGNDPAAREVDPEYAPGGRLLVYAYYRNGNWDLWALDPATGDKKIVTNHFASDLEPAWSPDGTRIAFASDRDGTFDIWVLE